MRIIILAILTLLASDAWACKNQQQVLAQMRFHAKGIRPEATMATIGSIASIQRLAKSCSIDPIPSVAIRHISRALGYSPLIDRTIMGAYIQICGSNESCTLEAISGLSRLVTEQSELATEIAIRTLRALVAQNPGAEKVTAAAKDLIRLCLVGDYKGQEFCRQAQLSIPE